jgi:hypothetical protein
MKSIKVGVAIMVHNMEDLISACVSSVNWADGIYIFDDHCTDKTIANAKKHCSTKLIVEFSPFKKTAFEHGELETRNYIIEQAFKRLKVDVLVLLDADELLADTIRPVIESAFSNKYIDSVAFSIWHLYTKKKYIHIWETSINGTHMVDPHIRIITKNIRFHARYSDGSHPGITFTSNTLCLHGAYHFHVKYMEELHLPNYSFHFLPKYFTEKEVTPFLRALPFTLPSDIQKSLSLLQKSQGVNEYAHYVEARTKLSSPEEALIHPRDLKT